MTALWIQPDDPGRVTRPRCLHRRRPDRRHRRPRRPGSTSGDEDTTFDHDNDGISPVGADRPPREGRPAALHVARPQLPEGPLPRRFGNVLRVARRQHREHDRRCRPASSTATACNALGAPNYANRIRENIGDHDLGRLARVRHLRGRGPRDHHRGPDAHALPDRRRAGAQLFDASNQCQADGITCLIGVPADGRAPRLLQPDRHERDRPPTSASALPSRPSWPRPTPASEETHHGQVQIYQA